MTARETINEQIEERQQAILQARSGLQETEEQQAALQARYDELQRALQANLGALDQLFLLGNRLPSDDVPEDSPAGAG